VFGLRGPGDLALSLADLGGWPGVLGRLWAGETLLADEAAAVLANILAGEAAESQIGAFVAALRVRGETPEEMAGMVRAMLAISERVPVSVPVLDTCGTGGDRSRTVNISTMAALVAAGCGVPVCKHGGRAASSASGSADVLEALGVVIDLGPAGVARCIERAGIGFCFAPRFHPAMRQVIPVRRALGVPTVFNFLGPLANPARAAYQVVGVPDEKMMGKVAAVLALNGLTRAMVVHGQDGLDELSTVSPSTVIELVRNAEGETTKRTYEVDPAELGLAKASLEDLQGGDPAENAALVRQILGGQAGYKLDIVLLNAAAGLVVTGRAASLPEGLALARQAVESGAARRALDLLVETSREAAGA
jgi:anthranilate phosphoribosyltransferase